MATTYIYLNKEDMQKLAKGEKVEIYMTSGLRNSDRLFLQPDLEEGERYERSRLFGMPDKR